MTKSISNIFLFINILLIIIAFIAEKFWTELGLTDEENVYVFLLGIIIFGISIGGFIIGFKERRNKIKYSLIGLVGNLGLTLFFLAIFFYYLLISYLIILICWNSYAILNGNLIGIIPIVIQLIIIYLIFDKNKLAKIGIKIWSIILIAGPSLSILGGLLKTVGGIDLDVNKLIERIIMLSIGILIFYYNDKTVKIEKITENELAQ